MASLEDIEDLGQNRGEAGDRINDGDNGNLPADGNPKMDVDEVGRDGIDPDILNSATSDIINRRRLLENDLRVMKQEFQRLTHEKSSMKDRIKDNLDKIENNRFSATILSTFPVS